MHIDDELESVATTSPSPPSTTSRSDGLAAGVQLRTAECFDEACCCDSGLSVTSDALGMVPTGGELTLFEAVGRWA